MAINLDMTKAPLLAEAGTKDGELKAEIKDQKNAWRRWRDKPTDARELERAALAVREAMKNGPHNCGSARDVARANGLGIKIVEYLLAEYEAVALDFYARKDAEGAE